MQLADILEIHATNDCKTLQL